MQNELWGELSAQFFKKELVNAVGGATISPRERPDGERPFYERNFTQKEMTAASKKLASMIHNVLVVDLEIEQQLRKPHRLTLKLLDSSGKWLEITPLLYPCWVFP